MKEMQRLTKSEGMRRRMGDPGKIIKQYNFSYKVKSSGRSGQTKKITGSIYPGCEE